MITTAGKNVLRARLEAATAEFAGTFYLAFSTDATTPTIADTTLTGEQTANGLARISVIAAHTVGQNTWTFAATPSYTASTLTTITKIALFDAATGGNMIDVGLVSAVGFTAPGDTCPFSLVISL